MKRTHIAWLSCLLFVAPALSAEPKRLSGIYPHLTMFNHEGECGCFYVAWLSCKGLYSVLGR